MFPPMLLHLRFGAPERHGLWLPLFLVWLILLPLVVLVLLTATVVDTALLLGGASYHHYTQVVLRCFGAVAASRGTSVRVRSNEKVVNIDLV